MMFSINSLSNLESNDMHFVMKLTLDRKHMYRQSMLAAECMLWCCGNKPSLPIQNLKYGLNITPNYLISFAHPIMASSYWFSITVYCSCLTEEHLKSCTGTVPSRVGSCDSVIPYRLLANQLYKLRTKLASWKTSHNWTTFWIHIRFKFKKVAYKSQGVR